MTDERRPDQPLDDLLHDGPHDLDHDLQEVVQADRASARKRTSRGGQVVLGTALIGILAAGAVVVLRPEWLPFDVPFSGDEAATVAAFPALTRDAPLRAGPGDDAATLILLPTGTRLRLLGRSADGRWVAAAAEDRPDLIGWLRFEDLEGVDLMTLTTVTADPSATGTRTTPAGPSDAPDLRLESAYVRDNRLFVSVLNAGSADARGTLLASVDGAAPVPLEGKSDEGLRSGQRIQAAVRGVFVQIRGSVTVTVSLNPSVTEGDQGNNTFDGIVEPDQPTDLELVSVERGASGLAVTVRNRSSIPITGAYTITVREPSPGTRLLGRLVQTGTIEAGATTVITFPDLREVDLTSISVELSTDAIQDGVLSNNKYPR